jgi:hypothetical protein
MVLYHHIRKFAQSDESAPAFGRWGGCQHLNVSDAMGPIHRGGGKIWPYRKVSTFHRIRAFNGKEMMDHSHYSFSMFAEQCTDPHGRNRQTCNATAL